MISLMIRIVKAREPKYDKYNLEIFLNISQDGGCNVGEGNTSMPSERKTSITLQVEDFKHCLFKLTSWRL